MPGLIESFEQNYRLGVPEMDETHRQFLVLLERLDSAPKAEFITLFPELLRHTEAHFAAENQWMQESAFPALHEHQDEHRRVLGDLQRFAARVAVGNTALGRAYIREQLPGWFDLHARTMDSALAAHLFQLRSFRISEVKQSSPRT